MKICRNCQRSYSNSFANCPQDGTPLSQSSEWSEGTLIRGKYRIVEKIGQGAMGAVYKAFHIRFNELRAIKVMMAELAIDKDFVKRFEHEAVVARKLHHRNAVWVEDIDETEDGQPFIVMEYVEGRRNPRVLFLCLGFLDSWYLEGRVENAWLRGLRPAVDQTSQPPVDQKYLEKGDSLLWYVRSSEGLTFGLKPPRQRICTIARPFVLLKS
jgi:hypothetical protein